MTVGFPRGGDTLVFSGVHTLLVKIYKYPQSTDFRSKKHPYFQKNADFFRVKNATSFIQDTDIG